MVAGLATSRQLAASGIPQQIYDEKDLRWLPCCRVQTFGAIFNLWSTLQHSDLLYPSNILPSTAVNKSDATAGASHNPEGASYFLLYSKPRPLRSKLGTMLIIFRSSLQYSTSSMALNKCIVIYRGLAKLPFHA